MAKAKNEAIRALKACEVQCRVQDARTPSRCLILLYKDARCDMSILDESFGPMGWKRNHFMVGGAMACDVSVWDCEKEQWISKVDIGEEGKNDAIADKAWASDSFKRACTNHGIGRELYTSPKIYMDLSPFSYNSQKGVSVSPFINFEITKFEVKGGNIIDLSIVASAYVKSEGRTVSSHWDMKKNEKDRAAQKAAGAVSAMEEAKFSNSPFSKGGKTEEPKKESPNYAAGPPDSPSKVPPIADDRVKRLLESYADLNGQAYEKAWDKIALLASVYLSTKMTDLNETVVVNTLKKMNKGEENGH